MKKSLSELSPKSSYIFKYLFEDYSDKDYISYKEFTEQTGLTREEIGECIRRELVWLDGYTILESGSDPGIFFTKIK